MARRRHVGYTVRRGGRTSSVHRQLQPALERAKRLAERTGRTSFVAKQVGKQSKIVARCRPRKACQRVDGSVF